MADWEPVSRCCNVLAREPDRFYSAPSRHQGRWLPTLRRAGETRYSLESFSVYVNSNKDKPSAAMDAARRENGKKSRRVRPVSGACSTVSAVGGVACAREQD